MSDIVCNKENINETFLHLELLEERRKHQETLKKLHDATAEAEKTRQTLQQIINQTHDFMEVSEHQLIQLTGELQTEKNRVRVGVVLVVVLLNRQTRSKNKQKRNWRRRMPFFWNPFTKRRIN
jgi:hypothetical protein